MKIFNSIGHFFAWLGSTLTGAGNAVGSDLKLFEGAVSAPLAKAIESLSPAASARVVNAILAIGGDAMNAALNAGQAISQDGLNIALDTATVTAVTAAISDIRSVFTGASIPVATTTETAIVKS